MDQKQKENEFGKKESNKHINSIKGVKRNKKLLKNSKKQTNKVNNKKKKK